MMAGGMVWGTAITNLTKASFLCLLAALFVSSLTACRKQKSSKLQSPYRKNLTSKRGSRDEQERKARKGEVCVLLSRENRAEKSTDYILRAVFILLAEAARVNVAFDCSDQHEPRVEVDVGSFRYPFVSLWPSPGRLGEFVFVRSKTALQWTKDVLHKGKEVFGALVKEKSRLQLETTMARKLFSGARPNREKLYASLLAGSEWMIHGALKGDAGKLSDYLQVFYILQESASSRAFRDMGQRVGQRLTARYAKVVAIPDELAPLGELFDAAAGLFLIRKLGRRHPKLYSGIKAAFTRLPPEKILRNKRGRWRDHAEGILDALVDLYFLHELGIPTPVSYEKVVERALDWKLKEQRELDANTFDTQSYLVTHTIYVLSDFDLYELDPELLAPQATYIKKNLGFYIAMRDVETVGEFGDCLKILGGDYGDVHVRRIVKTLLGWQNEDGSWGERESKDPYVRYHSTWTAFNGLLEFRFEEKGPHSAWMRRLLKRIQK